MKRAGIAAAVIGTAAFLAFYPWPKPDPNVQRVMSLRSDLFHKTASPRGGYKVPMTALGLALIPANNCPAPFQEAWSEYVGAWHRLHQKNEARGFKKLGELAAEALRPSGLIAAAGTLSNKQPLGIEECSEAWQRVKAEAHKCHVEAPVNGPDY